jgi:hypothetical protein
LGNLGISGRNAVLGKMNWVELMHDTGTDWSLWIFSSHTSRQMFSLTHGAVSVMQGSGQSGMLPGDTHLSMSSSCEDPTQNLTPFLEQHQGEASTYWFFNMVVSNDYNGWDCRCWLSLANLFYIHFNLLQLSGL